MSVVGIVLAAGKGTRMRSDLPKVLHRIAGRSLVEWSVGAALDAGVDRCVVVVGHGRDEVCKALTERFGDRVGFAVQEQQLGTGHAVKCGLDAVDADRVLVLYGDCPLIPSSTLASLLAQQGSVGLVTGNLREPTGYGRILRNPEGRVIGIREQKDCSAEERAITEVNPGIYAFDTAFLRDAIARLATDNAQGELYLTDVVEMADDVVDVLGDMTFLQGVNDRWQLADAAKVMRLRLNEGWARAGVGIVDPFSTFIDADCAIEPDCTIESNVHLRGRCTVGAGAVIDVGCVLEDVRVEAGAHLLPYTVAKESRIGPRATVGPFSHLRPATDLGPDSKVGNFCETKKTIVGEGSKVNHLAYVGDGVLGKHVNVGAGVIFCNYDGVQKHTTVLKDGVFVGSDSQIVAPVTVGEGAYIASGSTITKDVPADALAIARTRGQTNKAGFASKLRARFGASKKAGK